MTAKKLRLIFGIPFFTLLAVFWVTDFYFWLYPPGSDGGWRGHDAYGEFYQDQIDPQSPATELRPGDRIIAINGKNLAAHPGAIGDDYRMPPGSPYSMTVRRNGQELTFTWQTVPRPRGDFPRKRLIAVLFWLTGLLVLSLKAEDRQAWLLALMLGSSSSILGGGFPTAIPLDWLTLLIALARIGGWFSFPLLLHLFLYFPHPSPLLRRWPRLTKWLYAPLCLFVLPIFGVGRLPVDWNIPISIWPPMRWLNEHGQGSIAYLSLLAYLLAALACLWWGYRMADVIGRRRLRVVMWGSLLGFGSVFLVLVMEATGAREKLKTTWEWLQFSTLFTWPIVPLSFAYAIARHRVIPISLILRRGVRYLLVSRGSILLSLLFAGLIVTALLSLLFKYLRPSALTIGLVSAAEGIAAWQAARWLHRRYLAPVIDRRFFRQSYDSQRIVAELADSLRTTTGIPHLLESVANKLQSALQTESVMIFLRDEQTGDYRAAYGCVYSATDGRAISCGCASRLPQYAATLARLEQTGEPLELDGGEPSFHLALSTEANGHTRLTAEERRTLLDLKAAMLLPLKTKDAMPGVVALGARLGDLPFSGEDKRLLQSVGASASLALENAQLVEEMIEEARRRQEIEAENEQRAKELEEARQLQLSMLPKRMPQLPYVEIAAVMRTATEVGGDYYDFHVGADGALTVAIGDATGHGLKAGTVVAATKSLFNHLAGQSDLVATLDQASRALKKMNLRSLFMALTLVKLNGERLQCGVAGMPPMLIYRAATQTVEEIPLRGAPLGGLSTYDYRQTELMLGVNDTLLLLSDGLPERFNAAGEMFGYEPIKELLLTHASAPPQIIVERLLQAGDEWAGGKPADDDMTFVALRRNGDGGS
ncbi:MAG TPA: SpoIIE family protein phosphatase [Blastocatellia bacterium]|nr:SpoIIE family protein phosphatase [Blastocatellia bacterium]